MPENPDTPDTRRGGLPTMTGNAVPRMVLLSGFLGAGKTTVLHEAAIELTRRGHRPVIITNDQGQELVDTSMMRTSGLRAGEVTDGCFCCRFDDLVEVATELVARHDADVVLAEAVGSCTDIAATVVRPLRATGAMTVAPLTTVIGTDRLRHMLGVAADADGNPLAGVDEDIAYLFDKQAEEADVIALNKTDLCTEDELDELRWAVGQRWPDARLLETTARSGDGLGPLLDLWLSDLAGDAGTAGRDVEVDYDRYADAEAMMGWLNARVTTASTGGEFAAREWIAAFDHALRDELPADALVGHLKLQMAAGAGLTKASTISLARPLEFDRDDVPPSGRLVGLVNARIGATPEALEAAVRTAVRGADEATGTSSTVDQMACFSPSRPVPTHRIPASA